MLELTDLCKKYDEFSLGPIDLHLEPGTVHGLIGPNGAGKTTLFRCVMGTVCRDRGLIKVKGGVAGEDSGSWKQHIGYVGDYTPLFEHWSGEKNLKAFSAYYAMWSEETVRTLASRLDLNLSQVGDVADVGIHFQARAGRDHDHPGAAGRDIVEIAPGQRIAERQPGGHVG